MSNYELRYKQCVGLRRTPLVFRQAAAALLTLGLGAAAFGCSTTTSTSTGGSSPVGTGNAGVVEKTEAAQIGGKIVYGLIAETNGWNPSTNQWGPSGMQVARSMFDMLAAYDAKGDIHPLSAESFTPNADLTQWTIKLRPGMKLHNGKPVTASVIKRNQEFLKKSAVVGGAYLYVGSYTVKDDLTLVVKMNGPWGSYPQSLATQIGVIADPDWLESNDSLHPIGSGPFVFDKWEVGHKLVVKKNPAYWQKDANGVAYPYLDEVEFDVLADGATRAASLESKTIDILQTTDAGSIKSFREQSAESKDQVFTDATGETLESFVMLNTTVAPFDDVDARRALAYGTDRLAFIDDLKESQYEPASGAYAKSSKWYTPSGYPDFNENEARRLVEKVKAAHGSFKFTFAVGSSSTEAQRDLQWLQQHWADLGIDVTIETTEQAKQIIQVVTGNYQATLWQQFDSPHPVDDAIFWLPEESKPIPQFSLNFARFADPEIKTALAEARTTGDPQVELEAYRKVQRRQGEMVPYVWLYHLKMAVVSSPRLVNVVKYDLPDGTRGIDLANGSHPLHQVWLKQK